MNEEIMNNWINGNFSQLDRFELIELVRYFEVKAEGEEKC